MQCELPLHCKQTGQQRKNVHAQALYSWLLVACIIDIFKLSFINTLAWYFKCFLPEVVKNSIFKNEIIESLRRQAVILICPFKTRRAVVGAEHNVFSASLTLCLRNPSQGSPNSMLHSSQTTTHLHCSLL